METCVLVNKDGAVVKRYTCERQWGSITYDGTRYVARRMNNVELPDHIYVEAGR